VTVYRGADVTAAIVHAIDLEGLDVGAGEKPAGAGWQGAPEVSNFVPYVVVHPTPGGVFDGTIGVPFDDGQPDYVISAFGATQQQCQVVADVVWQLLTSRPLEVSGRVVQLAMPDVEGGVVKDTDLSPPVWYSPTRWRIYTTTA
jgi:hypothetical protein